MTSTAGTKGIVGALLLVLAGGALAFARPAPLAGVPVSTASPVLEADALVPAFDLQDDEDDDRRARPEPHGAQLCASGCALSRHPTPVLPKARYRSLLKTFASEPLTGGDALESLLFHGAQTAYFRENQNEETLDAAHAGLLDRELKRDHATVEFRVVDQSGRRRVYLPPTRVPLDQRQVFELDLVDLPRPLEISGTVKRVGLGHLWQRL